VDSIIIISNDKLREIHGNLAFSEAFAQADNILTTAAKGIAEIITITGYVNVDFEDVNTVMRDSGVAIMGSAQAEGEDRARRADMALNSPLLEDNNIMGAQNVLLNITSSSKRETTMDEISEITAFVQQEVRYGYQYYLG
jgi:cell division protein FtsZ